MTQKSLTFDECKQLSSRIIAMNPNRRANMGQISSHLLPAEPDDAGGDEGGRDLPAARPQDF